MGRGVGRVVGVGMGVGGSAAVASTLVSVVTAVRSATRVSPVADSLWVSPDTALLVDGGAGWQAESVSSVHAPVHSSAAQRPAPVPNTGALRSETVRVGGLNMRFTSFRGQWTVLKWRLRRKPRP